MQKFLALTTILFAAFSVAACQTKSLTEPCDVLVVIPDAKPATNSYLIKNDRPVAVGLAQHKLRVQEYKCNVR